MKVEVEFKEGDVIRLNDKTWDVIETGLDAGDTVEYMGTTFKAEHDDCCLLNPQIGKPRLIDSEYMNELIEYSGKFKIMSWDYLS